MIALSYTSFTNFKACPYFFKLKYVDKRTATIPQNNRFFVEGSVVHECLEEAFKHSRPIDTAYIESIFDRMFEKVYQDKLKNGVILYFTGENKEVLKFKSKQVLAVAINVIKKLGMDVGKFENEYSIGSYKEPYELKKGLYVQGSVDWLRENENGIVICDFKTSKDTTYVKPLQLILYSIALKKRFNKPITDAFYLMFRSGAKFGVTINDDLQNTVLQMFSEVNDHIEKGEFKATPSSKACGECVYRNICPHSYFKNIQKEITF